MEEHIVRCRCQTETQKLNRMKTHYLAMTINGKEVPSSCLKSGSEQDCLSSAKRMNRDRSKHPSVVYAVFPCISNKVN